MAGFDMEGARRAGYTDTEIAGFLAQQRNFDAEGARRAGYSDTDIISHLNESPAPAARGGVGRTLGLRTRDVIEGLGALPAGAVDVITQQGARRVIGDLTGQRWLGASAQDVPRGVANALSLPSPETAGERITSGLTQGVVGAIPTLGMGGLARTVPNALLELTAGGVGGGAGAGAAELVPERFKPLANLLGGVAGGAAVLAPVAGVRGAANVVREVTEPFAGRQAPVLDENGVPFRSADGQELSATPNQQRLAAEALQGQAMDLPRAIANIDSAPELVPGSPATLGQVAGDNGLNSAEGALARANPVPFIEQRGQQAGARLAALDTVGGNGTPTDVAAAFRDRLTAIDRGASADVQAARAEAGRADAALPGTTRDPEVAGARLRELAENREALRRTEESALWNQIDPDNTLTIEVSPIRQEADRIRGGMTDSATPMGGEEARIFARAADLPAIIPLRELTDLRAAIRAETSALRNSAGTSTPATQRLSALRTEIESAMGTAVARQEALRSAGLPAGNFDNEAQARTEAANTVSRDRADRYGARSGFVNGVLARGNGPDGFANPTAALPQRVVVAGPQGGQRLRTYLAAAGDDPATLAAVDDAAVMMARRHAANADGTLDPAKLRAWVRTHQEFLAERPDLARSLGDVAAAQDFVAEAVQRRTDAMDRANEGAAAKLMGLSTPEGVSRTIGTMLRSNTSGEQMAALAADVAGRPAARDGVRRGIADFIRETYVSNTEAGTSGNNLVRSDQYQTFMRRNRDALAHFFTPDELNTLTAVADDLHRANRSIAGGKLPGGSDTVQRQAAMDRLLTRGGSASGRLLWSLFGGAGGAGITGGAFGGLPAVAGAAGAEVVRAMRAAGMTSVRDLMTEAMLNPRLGRVLLTRVTDANRPQVMRALVGQLGRLAASRAALAPNAEQREPRPGAPRNALMGG